MKRKTIEKILMGCVGTAIVGIGIGLYLKEQPSQPLPQDYTNNKLVITSYGAKLQTICLEPGKHEFMRQPHKGPGGYIFSDIKTIHSTNIATPEMVKLAKELKKDYERLTFLADSITYAQKNHK